ncbi:phenylacetaldoxime dehydratase family protein [Agromyces archimandritae]|uniref:Phenylacetaldoxime dehydratase family protein n=1 Tax=Agromyces archimandritae TaxID=2781962 RepID=A0A975IP80_9MICO|nr:phenylacetaldoxime dehydratase family protein [Agromyces archimandritae]QTX05377.1 phenylacetaldoxime dehydratase family protein [Agromyces archimandritae]
MESRGDAMSWQPEYPRRIPERRPAGHRPRAPRWSAEFERPFTAVTSDYYAVQVRDASDPAVDVFLDIAAASVDAGVGDAPDASEILTHRTADAVDVIFLGYWTDPTRHARWARHSALGRWFRDLDAAEVEHGAWRETIQVPLERAETIYSSPDREFGFAACEGIRLGSTTSNGYFGAARDRMPLSAIDPLEAPAPHTRRESVPSAGRRLRAALGLNVAVIRSGQYWEASTGEQLEDYERELEPKLLAGMDYLATNPDDTGTISLRILRSGDPRTVPARRETSVLGHFSSLEQLETWAANHATHAAIYEHAIAKNRQYGEARQVTTWHEVFVLAESTRFEYVNCHPATGVLAYAEELWQPVGHD